MTRNTDFHHCSQLVRTRVQRKLNKEFHDCLRAFLRLSSLSSISADGWTFSLNQYPKKRIHMWANAFNKIEQDHALTDRYRRAEGLQAAATSLYVQAQLLVPLLRLQCSASLACHSQCRYLFPPTFLESRGNDATRYVGIQRRPEFICFVWLISVNEFVIVAQLPMVTDGTPVVCDLSNKFPACRCSEAP